VADLFTDGVCCRRGGGAALCWIIEGSRWVVRRRALRAKHLVQSRSSTSWWRLSRHISYSVTQRHLDVTVTLVLWPPLNFVLISISPLLLLVVVYQPGPVLPPVESLWAYWSVSVKRRRHLVDVAVTLAVWWPLTVPVLILIPLLLLLLLLLLRGTEELVDVLPWAGDVVSMLTVADVGRRATVSTVQWRRARRCSRIAIHANQVLHVQGGPKKWGHRLMITILSNLNRFLQNFTERVLRKFAIKWILKIPSHLAYVATLPCETSMSAKQAINDKLQGSVATYWRCGWVVNNQIRKGLLLSLSVKFLIGKYLAKLQARAWLSRALT